jgi:Tfp pilus assembly protein PilX
VDGFFIGTCFDGVSVFEKLKYVEHHSIMVDDTMIFDVQKKYSQTGFVGDETSVGYAINVYQESINKYAIEYLVHFHYLVRLMENYGFKLLTNTEANHHGFPSGSGLFSELFHQMKKEGTAMEMSEKEKEISFLNRYFIFRKIHDVNAEKVYRSITKTIDKEGIQEAVKEVLKTTPVYVKRLKHKVVLQSSAV